MTKITIKTPFPHYQHQIGTKHIKSDENGLVELPAGSEEAKALISAGCTVLAPLPEADPKLAGVLWNNAGTLTISAG
jgi:hypothetical protein